MCHPRYQGPFHDKKFPRKTFSGLYEEYTISHICLYIGKHRWGLPTSYWPSLLWISSSMVILIPNMNWLDSSPKSSCVSTFSEWWIYMRAAYIFIIRCNVALPLLFTSKYLLMREFKDWFIKINSTSFHSIFLINGTACFSNVFKLFFNSIQLTSII